jgi:hypothetical protein
MQYITNTCFKIWRLLSIMLITWISWVLWRWGLSLMFWRKIDNVAQSYGTNSEGVVVLAYKLWIFKPWNNYNICKWLMKIPRFVVSPRGRNPNGNNTLMDENRGFALILCHWLFGRSSSEPRYSRGNVWVYVLQYQRPVVLL